MRDVIEFFAAILPVFVIFFVLLAFFALAGHGFVSYQCDNFERITGKETRMAAFDACYVKTNDGWQRWDEYKARAIASEGLNE